MHLERVLESLLLERELPRLDRWYAALAKKENWSYETQRKLWDNLRRAMACATAMDETQSVDGERGWEDYRKALAGHHRVWAQASLLPALTAQSARLGVPSWLVPALAARRRLSGWSDTHTSKFLASQTRGLPVHVRFLTSREGLDLRQKLAGKGHLSTYEAIAQYLGPRKELSGLLSSGLMDIQDASSQLSLSELDLRQGQRVWDICAGNGGKTTLVADTLGNHGVVVATDTSPRKLTVLKKRVSRQKWQTVRTQLWDGEKLPLFGLEITKNGGFDRVILDAPCSASGTWRRDPEARFRLTKEGLNELMAIQLKLLRLGWSALKFGGRLAYITCSWIPSENEGVMEAFLSGVPAKLLSQQILGTPHQEANTMMSFVLEKS